MLANSPQVPRPLPSESHVPAGGNDLDEPLLQAGQSPVGSTELGAVGGLAWKAGGESGAGACYVTTAIEIGFAPCLQASKKMVTPAGFEPTTLRLGI